MYYCISCSEIHYKRNATDKVFENGFYIDPFGGRRLHLGMCQSAVKHEVPIPHELEAEIPDAHTILNDFPLTDVTPL
ncbi:MULTISPECIES: DUF3973 domain-containing protein [unclassified Bacillus (in: firmicutes)]|uniref:DUF3973 domain-containing protein n=1 Tax=unclassified Bacillus (in: firmicutes) TaxID=185979 RepID=UPI003D20EF13